MGKTKHYLEHMRKHELDIYFQEQEYLHYTLKQQSKTKKNDNRTKN